MNLSCLNQLGKALSQTLCSSLQAHQFHHQALGQLERITPFTLISIPDKVIVSPDFFVSYPPSDAKLSPQLPSQQPVQHKFSITGSPRSCTPAARQHLKASGSLVKRDRNAYSPLCSGKKKPRLATGLNAKHSQQLDADLLAYWSD